MSSEMERNLADRIADEISLVPNGTDVVELDPKDLGTELQPREWTRADEELIDSIRATKGNMEPIHVWEHDNTYTIISGHRRTLACSKLGIPVKAIIWKDMTEEQARAYALMSNVSRQKMTVPEIIEAIKTIKDRMSNKELQQLLGLPKNTFYRYLRISRLPKIFIQNLGYYTQEQLDCLSRFQEKDIEWASEFKEHLWKVQSIYSMVADDGPILQRFRNQEFTEENINYIFEKTSKFWRIICEDHLEGCIIHEKDEECSCECNICTAPEVYKEEGESYQPAEKQTTKCGRCKQPLTDPHSVKVGYGPVCAGKSASEGDERAKTAYDYYDSLGYYREDAVPSGTEEICECEGDVLCEKHAPKPVFGICSCGNEAEMKCPKCDYAVCESPKCKLQLSSHRNSSLHNVSVKILYEHTDGYFVDDHGRKWRLEQ